MKFNVRGKELVEVLEVLNLNEVIVLGSSGVSLLGFHGGEHRHWSLQLVEKLLVVFDSFSDGLVDGFDLVPLLSLDEGASLHEPVNDLRVVESKSNLSNLDVLLSWTIDSVVWELVESLLELKLDVELELLDLSHWISWVKVVLHEVTVDGLIDIELDGVISSSDSFHIKVDILGLLESLDIVKVDNSEEIDEHSSASSDQSEYLALISVVLW